MFRREFSRRSRNRALETTQGFLASGLFHFHKCGSTTRLDLGGKELDARVMIDDRPASAACKDQGVASARR